MLHTGKKRYRLFLSPKKREQRCDYTNSRWSQVFLLNLLFTPMLHREEEIQILVGSRRNTELEESPNDCRHRSAQNATMAAKSSTADPRTEAQSATTTTTTIHTRAYSKQRDQRERRRSGEAEGHGQQKSRKTSCT
ncbi:unnamed protein product [Sphagnum balticum]